MKRIVAVVLIVLILTGCTSVKIVNDKTVAVSRFAIVENCSLCKVVVDRETKVMYAVSYGTYNIGIFTMLVDADGKPLLWEGELK